MNINPDTGGLSEIRKPTAEKTFLFLTLLVLVLVSVSACRQSGYFAPVGYSGRTTGSHYVVRKGDTLYSIAFRFGLDYRSLAKANKVQPPFTIFVHQKLKITGVPMNDVADSKPDYKVKSTPKPDYKVKSTPKPNKVVGTISTGNEKLIWNWPLEGKVVKQFSLKGRVNKGIDIGAKTGQFVVSAAKGVVVYAGGGLRGYGKLVIVKHNENLLSAYGNNRKLLVKEGQSVNAGQQLAKMGGKGSLTESLHFEIRRGGKPQNPLKYLPKVGR